MKKRKAKRQRFRPFYSHIDVLMASQTDPMPESTRQHWLTRTHLALDAIARGETPGPEDWRQLSDAVNLMETMIDRKIVDDPDNLKDRAKEAMVTAGQAYLDGKAMRLGGVGIQALRDLLADMGELMAVIPHREFLRVHIATERAVHKILTEGSCADDVVVAV